MKILWTTTYVNDLEESIKFYEEIVGLKVINEIHGEPEIAFMGYGKEKETLLELVKSKDVSEVEFNNFISIGFRVSSVNEKIKELKEKNIKITGGPVTFPDSSFFFIKDPNGLTVQFVENNE